MGKEFLPTRLDCIQSKVFYLGGSSPGRKFSMYSSKPMLCKILEYLKYDDSVVREAESSRNSRSEDEDSCHTWPILS